jgi:hypothetical protein
MDKLYDYLAMWEKAQETDDFKKASKPPTPEQDPIMKQSYFGQNQVESDDEDLSGHSHDFKYWRDVHEKLAGGHSVDPLSDIPSPDNTDQILREFTEKVKRKFVTGAQDGSVHQHHRSPDRTQTALKKMNQALGTNPNPVYPNTVGKDQDYNPSWADVNQLEQLHDMRVNLHELESKLNSKDALAQTKQGKTIQNQINSLWTQIDNLSNSITPDFLDDNYVTRDRKGAE